MWLSERSLSSYVNENQLKLKGEMHSTVWVFLWFQMFLPTSLFATPLRQTERGVPTNHSSNSNIVKDYMVFPEDPFSSQVNKKVLEQLKSVVGKDHVRVLESGGESQLLRKSVEFWFITVDDSQLDEICTLPGVCEKYTSPCCLNPIVAVKGSYLGG